MRAPQTSSEWLSRAPAGIPLLRDKSSLLHNLLRCRLGYGPITTHLVLLLVQLPLIPHIPRSLQREVQYAHALAAADLHLLLLTSFSLYVVYSSRYSRFQDRGHSPIADVYSATQRMCTEATTTLLGSLLLGTAFSTARTKLFCLLLGFTQF